MKLIIDIPEGMYQTVLDGTYCGSLYEELKNGIPIPKSFDLDGLKSDMKALRCGFPYGLDYLLDCLKQRLGITIADIDKEE